MTEETIRTRECPRCGTTFDTYPHRMRIVGGKFRKWRAGDCPTCGHKWTGPIASFDSEIRAGPFDTVTVGRASKTGKWEVTASGRGSPRFTAMIPIKVI